MTDRLNKRCKYIHRNKFHRLKANTTIPTKTQIPLLCFIMTDFFANSLLLAYVSVIRHGLLQKYKKFQRLGLHTLIYVVMTACTHF